jgi:hypothetical protein
MAIWSQEIYIISIVIYIISLTIPYALVNELIHFYQKERIYFRAWANVTKQENKRLYYTGLVIYFLLVILIVLLYLWVLIFEFII